MLFTPESIVKVRRALFEQMETGALPREQAFRQALELDPCDFVALMVIGEERFVAGDPTGAAEYYWRAANADSCRFAPWFKLAATLPGESQAFRDGLQELGALKARRDPEGVEQFEELLKKKPAAADFPDGEALLAMAAEQLHGKRRDEPEEVSHRLRPYRLVDDLLETADDGLEQELVDGILEDGARCLPLLVGVLRAMATGFLPGGDAASTVSSLALIGEIGEPAVLPELIECYSVDDDDIREAAQWAVRRIASRRPDQSLDVVRKLTSGVDAAERCSIALALSHFPEQPGKRDVLLGLLDGLTAFPKSDRHELFMSVAIALGLSEGTKGPDLAWSLFGRYAAILPKRTRSELREAMRVRAALERIAPETTDDAPAATVYDLCCPAWEDEDDDEAGDEEDEDEDDNPLDDEDDFDDDDDDDEDFVPEPVRRAVKLGRNDPCWCGSGKKYKKCHLESDEKARPSPPKPENAKPQGNAEEAELRGRLIAFATETLRKRGMDESLQTFIGPEAPAGGDNDTLSREALDWMVHDYVPPRLGHPMIEEFLKRSPGGLTMRQRKILETWSRARYSIFEVQEVREGSGVRLKDLLAGGESFVNDVSTSKWAVQWDCFLARVEEFDGRYSFTAMVVSIPQPSIAAIKDWAIGARQRSGLDWGAFLRANSHKLRQEASRLMNRGADPMRVVSFEGDALVFSRARYAVLDEEAVRSALDQSKAFLRDEDPADYGWLDEAEDAGGARRAYGHIHIAGGELTLECSTRQRLERGKALLRDLAGEHLRHLGDNFTSLQAAMRERKDSPSPAKGSGLPPEVERELMQKVLAEHYNRWVDMPLPALDGKTPREAAATPEGRAQVVDLLKLLQNGEEHKRRDGLAWFDVSKLKMELGVEF